jgi:exopolysaccharide biosynthesis polyprenyl glycosylphosphotransferase
LGLTEMWTAPRPSAGRVGDRHRRSAPGSCKIAKTWMMWDALTAMTAALIATLIQFRVGLRTTGLWADTPAEKSPVGLFLVVLAGFILAVLLISQQLHLYRPRLLRSLLHEQKLTIQACIIAGLLLGGSLYAFDATAGVTLNGVILALTLISVCLCLRRMLHRLLRYRNFERGIGTRNLLIVGVGPEAQQLRHDLERTRHFGFVVKGMIVPGVEDPSLRMSPEAAGDLEGMFDYARQHFVDEILVASPVEHTRLREMLFRAHQMDIDLRFVPAQLGEFTINNPVEYIGQFPTIPLRRNDLREFEQTLKRALDIALSSVIMALLLPTMLTIAILIRMDSPGDVFYLAERLGKKGRVFKCIKFRTMVSGAEKQCSELSHLNERDGILFKITNDPRITRVGRILRKYSLDELPQFLNVLKGEMSIVGPRPPLGSEVLQYKLHHLRRLNVMPGITGLWQVQARQDPSFDNYISLDLAYIDNWSIWLDLKIIMRTIAVVIAGTGS